MRFLSDDAKARGLAAVRTFELKTSAELVLSVKKESSRYPQANLAAGALFAFSSFLLLLFHPYEFDVRWMPLDVALAFGLGFGLSRSIARFRRLFLLSKTRENATTTLAKELFHDLGITHTSGRSGIFVMASILENHVVLIFDRGIPAALREAASAKKAELERALASDNFEEFATLLESLGDAFASLLPRAEDDVNELSDEIV